MGPLEVSKPWNDNNVQGAKRFITRVWNFFTEPENIIEEDDGKLTRIYHQTVKKVTKRLRGSWLQYCYQPDDDLCK